MLNHKQTERHQTVATTLDDTLALLLPLLRELVRSSGRYSRDVLLKMLHQSLRHARSASFYSVLQLGTGCMRLAPRPLPTCGINLAVLPVVCARRTSVAGLHVSNYGTTAAVGLSQLHLINEEFVTQHLSVASLLPSLERVFVAFSDPNNHDICMPLRGVVEIEKHQGELLTMPAYDGGIDCIAVKVLTAYHRNPSRGLPRVHSLMVLFDAKTGAPRAMLESANLTLMRTATATAVATKHLSTSRACVLAIIGTGRQAEGHINALRQVRDFTQVRVVARNKERCEALAGRTNSIVCTTIEEAVNDADVVVTLTTSTEPLLQKSWLKPNALINVIGGVVRTEREVSDELMRTSQLIADTKESAEVQAGDFVATGATVDFELGDVIASKKKPDFTRIRIFKSQGMAAEDVAAADVIYKKYLYQQRTEL